MAITIKCTCGKSLKADEKYLGKKAKCPACGASVLIEDQSASKSEPEAPKKKSAPPPDDDDDRGSKVQSEAPRKKPAARKDDDDDDDDPEPRKPIKRQEEPKKSNMKMYVLGGCGALLVLTCCFSGLGTGLLFMMGWWPFNSGADLAYVHDDVAGFVSFRVADTWKSEAVKDFLAKAPAQVKLGVDQMLADIEKKGDMKIEDVERVTVIMSSMEKGRQPDVVAVVKTSKSIDEKKAVADFEKEAKDTAKKKDGGIYVLEKSGKAVHFASSNIVLSADNEAHIRAAIKGASKAPTSAAITRGLQLANSGKHLVMAFKAPKKLIDDGPGAMAANKAPTMKEMNGFIMSGTATKDLSLEFVLTFPSKDLATKAKGEADAFHKEAKDELAKPAKGFFAPPKGLIDFVNAMTIEQSGSEVIVKGKISDIGSIIGGFIGMFAGAGPDFGAGPPNVGPGPGDPIMDVRMAAQRAQSTNNLKQIMFAMHNFHDNNKSLPNHAIRHPQTGQELLSWRVALLPHLEQNALYQQIRLNERWDSPHNRQFWNRMPNVYKHPGRFDQDRTYYQVFHGPASAFPKTNRAPGGNPLTGDMRMTSITDGTSNTIFVVEASTSVNWMAPDDIPFVMGDIGLRNRVGNHWTNLTFLAAMGDGTVRPMRRTMTQQNLQGLITRAGNEVVNPDE